jgi:iduronate 2-sulfatase
VSAQVVDDLRDEIAGLFGKDYMHTPNIDALAAKSLGLKKTHVQQALCGPSRASFLTGRRPETTRIYDLHTYWRDAGGDFVTVPQHFAENGYATRGFGKIMHPVCGSAAHDSPGECDPLSWTLPYFHSPNEARWTCSSGMVGHGCDAEMPSHYAVSKAEEQAHPLPDTQNCDAAMQQLVDFAAARDDPSQPPPPPFFLAMGFHKP